MIVLLSGACAVQAQRQVKLTIECLPAEEGGVGKPLWIGLHEGSLDPYGHGSLAHANHEHHAVLIDPNGFVRLVSQSPSSTPIENAGTPGQGEHNIRYAALVVPSELAAGDNSQGAESLVFDTAGEDRTTEFYVLTGLTIALLAMLLWILYGIHPQLKAKQKRARRSAEAGGENVIESTSKAADNNSAPSGRQ